MRNERREMGDEFLEMTDLVKMFSFFCGNLLPLFKTFNSVVTLPDSPKFSVQDKLYQSLIIYHFTHS